MTSPANIYLVKVNNIEIREKSFKVSSKLKIATTERRHQCRSGVFIVNFEHISYLLSTLACICLLDVFCRIDFLKNLKIFLENTREKVNLE